MLDKLFGLKEEADLIWAALFNVFSKGYFTQELAGKITQKDRILSTTAFGDMVVEYIKQK